MPDIDIRIDSQYVPGGTDAAISAQQKLREEIIATARAAAGDIPEGASAASSGARAAEEAGAQARAAQGGATSMREAAMVAGGFANNMREATVATRAQTGQLAAMRAEMEAIQRIRADPASRETMQAMLQEHGYEGTGILRAKAQDDDYVAGLQRRINAAQATGDLRRIRPGEEIEAAQHRAGLEEANREARRIREGESIDAAHTRALAENVQREEAERMANLRRVRQGEEVDAAQERAIQEDLRREQAARRDNLRRVREGEEVEAAQERAQSEERRRMSQRVRPGEEMDALQTRAAEEDARRDIRNARAAETAERREIYDTRRESFDQFLAGTVLLGAGGTAIGGLKSMVQSGASQELTRRALENQVGGNAPEQITQARADAQNVYGANYQDLLQYEIELRKFNITGGEARRTVMALADAAAASGGGADKLHTVVTALEQIQDEGQVTAIALRRLETAGIPAAEIISKQLGITQAELMRMIQGHRLTSEVARQALVTGLESDPRFAGKSASLETTTLAGTQDRLSKALQHLDETVETTLAPTLERVIGVATFIADFFAEHPRLTEVGAFGVGAVGVGATALGSAALAAQSYTLLKNALPDSWKGAATAEEATALTGSATALDASAAALTAAAAKLALGGGIGGAAGTAAEAEEAGAEGAAAGAGVEGGIDEGLRGGIATLGAPVTLWDGAAAALAEGAGVLFAPESLVAVTLAAGVRLAVDRLYNKPMEDAVGPGSMTAAEKAHGLQQFDADASGKIAMDEKVLRDAQERDRNRLNSELNPTDWQRIKHGVRDLYAPWTMMGSPDAQPSEATRLAALNLQTDRRVFAQRQGAAQSAQLQSGAELYAKANNTGWANQGDLGPSFDITNAPVVNHSDGGQTVTIKLTIPPHPTVKRVVNDLAQATRT